MSFIFSDYDRDDDCKILSEIERNGKTENCVSECVCEWVSACECEYEYECESVCECECDVRKIFQNFQFTLKRKSELGGNNFPLSFLFEKR